MEVVIFRRKRELGSLIRESGRSQKTAFKLLR